MLISYALLRLLALTLFSLANHIANLLNSQWKVAYLSKVWISCFDFSTKISKLADDMKGFLALGYSLLPEEGFLEHGPNQGHGLRFQEIVPIVFVLSGQIMSRLCEPLFWAEQCCLSQGFVA